MIWKKLLPETLLKTMNDVVLTYNETTNSVSFEKKPKVREKVSYTHFMNPEDLFNEDLVRQYQQYHKTDWNVWYTIESARSAFNRLDLPYIATEEGRTIAIVRRIEPLTPYGYPCLRLDYETEKWTIYDRPIQFSDPKEFSHIMPMAILIKPSFVEECMLISDQV